MRRDARSVMPRCSGNGDEGIVADTNRITTVKTRIVARHQQIVRVDRERREPLSHGDDHAGSRLRVRTYRLRLCRHRDHQRSYVRARAWIRRTCFPRRRGSAAHGVHVHAYDLLVPCHDARLDVVIRVVSATIPFVAIPAASRHERIARPASSSPITPKGNTTAPSAARFAATFPAPPKTWLHS